MRRGADVGQYGQTGIDFFISYSPPDIRWAEWIAWQLERAGYRIMMQAWDFVPGTNFIDFMDRGVSESLAVVAVLSQSYMRSKWGRWEWQTAIRSSPERPDDRLITVRIEDFEITGLLANITFLDLVGVDDPAVAQRRLLQRIGAAVNGRAKPPEQPPYPVLGRTLDGIESGVAPPVEPVEAHPRLRTRPPVVYPPRHRDGTSPSVVRLLQIAGLGLGPHGRSARRILDEFEIALGSDPEIDALLIGGDLTAAGGIRDFDQALDFVIGLRRLLNLPPHRVALVPGPADLTLAASRAYFSNCEADEIEPELPYWPKWRHYARFFDNLYDGVDGASFTQQQPWSLFEMGDLRIVVAGLNATMADSHLGLSRHSTLGRSQGQWFGRALRNYPEPEWLRVGLIGGDRALLPEEQHTLETGVMLTSPESAHARLLTAHRADGWRHTEEIVPIEDQQR